MKITRIKQSCFIIESESGTIIIIDPYQIPEGTVKADIVLTTHDHPDHYDAGSLARIKKDETIVVCPASCKKIIKKWNARGLAVGETLDAAGITIKAVPAYNKKKPFHSRGKHYLGYIMSIDEKSLYHAGDTDFIEEMKDIHSPDVAFIPIGGFFTMSAGDAIEAIKVIKPVTLIPMHEIKQDLAAFAAEVQSEVPDVKVCALQAGESMTI
ncbi:MAG TPA: MBL fold metallo-hydrolase [Candidatus Lokiarchaeia archaeon]|nr:MBL fold metallo-hydrolase [Candidatus Lokiarchaeia archaeon]